MDSYANNGDKRSSEILLKEKKRLSVISNNGTSCFNHYPGYSFFIFGMGSSFSQAVAMSESCFRNSAPPSSALLIC